MSDQHFKPKNNKKKWAGDLSIVTVESDPIQNHSSLSIHQSHWQQYRPTTSNSTASNHSCRRGDVDSRGKPKKIESIIRQYSSRPTNLLQPRTYQEHNQNYTNEESRSKKSLEDLEIQRIKKFLGEDTSSTLAAYENLRSKDSNNNVKISSSCVEWKPKTAARQGLTTNEPRSVQSNPTIHRLSNKKHLFLEDERKNTIRNTTSPGKKNDDTSHISIFRTMQARKAKLLRVETSVKVDTNVNESAFSEKSGAKSGRSTQSSETKSSVSQDKPDSAHRTKYERQEHNTVDNAYRTEEMDRGGKAKRNRKTMISPGDTNDVFVTTRSKNAKLSAGSSPRNTELSYKQRFEAMSKKMNMKMNTNFAHDDIPDQTALVNRKSSSTAAPLANFVNEHDAHVVKRNEGKAISSVTANNENDVRNDSRLSFSPGLSRSTSDDNKRGPLSQHTPAKVNHSSLMNVKTDKQIASFESPPLKGKTRYSMDKNELNTECEKENVSPFPDERDKSAKKLRELKSDNESQISHSASKVYDSILSENHEAEKWSKRESETKDNDNISSLNEERDSLVAQMQELEAEKNLLASQLSRAKIEKDQIKSNYDDILSEKLKLEKRSNELVKESKHLSRQLDMLTEEHQRSEKIKDDAIGHLKNFQIEHDKVKTKISRIQELEDTIEMLKNQLSDVLSEKEKVLKRMNELEALEDRIKEITNEKNSALSQLDDIESQLVEVSFQKDHLNSEMRDLMEDKKRVEEFMDEIKDERDFALLQVKNLRTEVDRLRDEYNAMSESKTESSNNVDALRSDLDKAQSKLKNITNEMAAVCDKFERVTEEKRDIELKLRDLKEEGEEDKKKSQEKIDQLTSEQKELAMNLAQVLATSPSNSSKSNNVKEAMTVSDMANATRLKMFKLHRELREKSDKLDLTGKEVQRLKDDLQAKDDEIEKSKVLVKSNSEKNDFDKECVMKELAEVKKKLKLSRSKVMEYELQCRDKDKLVVDLQIQVLKHQEHLSKLGSECEQKHLELEEIRAKNVSLNDELNEAVIKLRLTEENSGTSDLLKECEEKDEQLKKIQIENSALKAEIETKDAELRKVSDELQVSYDHTIELMDKCDAGKEQIEKKDNVLNNSRAKIEELQLELRKTEIKRNSSLDDEKVLIQQNEDRAIKLKSCFAKVTTKLKSSLEQLSILEEQCKSCNIKTVGAADDFNTVRATLDEAMNEMQEHREVLQYITQYSFQSKKLVTALSETELELKSSLEEVSKWKGLCKASDEKLENVEDRLSTVQIALRNATSDLKSSDEEAMACKMKCNELKDKLEKNEMKLNESIATAKAETTKREEILAILKTNKDELQRRDKEVDELEMSLMEIKLNNVTEVKEWKERYETCEERLKQMKDKFFVTKESLEERLEEAEQKSQISNDKIEDLQTMLSQARLDLKSSQVTISDSKAKCVVLEEKLKQTQVELNENVKATKAESERCTKIKDNLELVIKELKTSKEKGDELESAAKRTQLVHLAEVEDWKMKYECCEGRLKDMEEELKNSAVAIKFESDKLHEATEETNKTVRALELNMMLLKKSKDKVKELESIVSEMNIREKSSRDVALKWKESLEESEEKCQRTQNEVNEKLNNAQTIINENKTKVNELESLLSKTKLEISEWKERFEAADLKSRDLQKKVNESCEVHKIELENTLKNSEEAIKENVSLKKKIAEFEETGQELQERIVALKVESEQASRDLSTANWRMRTAEKEICSLKEEIKSKEAKLNEARNEMQTSRNELLKYKMLCEKNKNEMIQICDGSNLAITPYQRTEKSGSFIKVLNEERGKIRMEFESKKLKLQETFGELNDGAQMGKDENLKEIKDEDKRSCGVPNRDGGRIRKNFEAKRSKLEQLFGETPTGCIDTPKSEKRVNGEGHHEKSIENMNINSCSGVEFNLSLNNVTESNEQGIRQSERSSEETINEADLMTAEVDKLKETLKLKDRDLQKYQNELKISHDTVSKAENECLAKDKKLKNIEDELTECSWKLLEMNEKHEKLHGYIAQLEDKCKAKSNHFELSNQEVDGNQENIMKEMAKLREGLRMEKLKSKDAEKQLITRCTELTNLRKDCQSKEEIVIKLKMDLQEKVMKLNNSLGTQTNIISSQVYLDKIGQMVNIINTSGDGLDLIPGYSVKYKVQPSSRCNQLVTRSDTRAGTTQRYVTRLHQIIIIFHAFGNGPALIKDSLGERGSVEGRMIISPILGAQLLSLFQIIHAFT